MDPEKFCYWLNGFCELNGEPPTAEQWTAIKEHLATVFTKVTPLAPGNMAWGTMEEAEEFAEWWEKQEEEQKKGAESFLDKRGWILQDGQWIRPEETRYCSTAPSMKTINDLDSKKIC